MAEERKCPVFFETKLYKNPPCGAKILRKEPVLSSERVVGHISGPKDIKGCRTGEDDDLYYIYECEKGHALVRPDWWADVPIVPPETIEIVPNKDHPEWYLNEGSSIKVISPKWLATLFNILLWAFRETITEWIFGDFVSWLKGESVFVAEYADWIVGGVIISLAIAGIIWASIDTKNRWLNKRAWEVYDNLCEGFRDLTYKQVEGERISVYARIEKERGRLPDKGLDEIIKLFLDVEAERARCGMTPFSDDAQKALSIIFERMRNYINGKYGGRKYEKDV